jgi:PPM family protein phosphatase
VRIQAFIHAVEICPRRGAGQDRVAVVSDPDRVIIALADGAGGTSGGERAAMAVIEAAMRSPVDDWPMILAELELDPDRLGPGQTTAVILTVTRAGITGASAGDSGAWLIRGDEIEDLTRAQHRKPLIGDHSLAVPFAGGPLAGGTLLVASDGLLRFAKPEAIARAALGPDLATAAHELVALVRLPSGELPDDLAIVLCREA